MLSQAWQTNRRKVGFPENGVIGLRRGLLFLFLRAPLAGAQIAEGVHGQAAGILRTLLGHLLDMPRERALRPYVQLVPGHGTIDVDGARERLCNMRDGGHARATHDAARRSCPGPGYYRAISSLGLTSCERL